MPALRYVDDFFGTDRESCIEHAKGCFARRALAVLLVASSCHCARRVVKACLGETAISSRKLIAGNPLEILGVDVTLHRDGLRMVPSAAKLEKWTTRIQEPMNRRTSRWPCMALLLSGDPQRRDLASRGRQEAIGRIELGSSAVVPSAGQGHDQAHHLAVQVRIDFHAFRLVAVSPALQGH